MATTNTPMGTDMTDNDLSSPSGADPMYNIENPVAIPALQGSITASPEISPTISPNIDGSGSIPPPTERLPYDRTLRASPKRQIVGDIPESSNKRANVSLPVTAVKPKVILADSLLWRPALFSVQAGTTTPCASILAHLERKGRSSPSAMEELQQYANYDLENFTFLQEIIPNLFLGRYACESMCS